MDELTFIVNKTVKSVYDNKKKVDDSVHPAVAKKDAKIRQLLIKT